MCDLYSQPMRYATPVTMASPRAAPGTISSHHHHQHQQQKQRQPNLLDASSSQSVTPHPFIVNGSHRLAPAAQVLTILVNIVKGKGKGRYSSSWEPHLKAKGRHLPYGITQCYLPPDTSERAPPNPSHAGWYSIYLPRRDGRLS